MTCNECSMRVDIDSAEVLAITEEKGAANISIDEHQLKEVRLYMPREYFFQRVEESLMKSNIGAIVQIRSWNKWSWF
uniref:Uncharacterized protein n=1 Tax=Arion vulgaris TaxID=1028688 RepID=A0A0B6Y0G3_9EUPU